MTIYLCSGLLVMLFVGAIDLFLTMMSDPGITRKLMDLNKEMQEFRDKFNIKANSDFFLCLEILFYVAVWPASSLFIIVCNIFYKKTFFIWFAERAANNFEIKKKIYEKMKLEVNLKK
jgi:hypothetical protein